MKYKFDKRGNDMALFSSIGDDVKRKILGEVLANCHQLFSKGFSDEDIDRGLAEMAKHGESLDSLLAKALKTPGLDFSGRGAKIVILTNHLGADVAISDEADQMIGARPGGHDGAMLFCLAMVSNEEALKKAIMEEG
jgi:hypothetical protein